MRSRKILLIDDDESLRKVYKRFLIQEGFEVLEAAGAGQALDKFASEKFDLILLDIRMRDEGSGTLVGALQERHPSSRVVVSSCYSVTEQRCMIPNAHGYHDKSEGCRALLTKINGLYANI